MNNASNAEFLKKFRERDFKHEKIKKFNGIIESCDDTTMQKLIRDIPLSDLIIAINGMTENAVEKFFGNMSKNLADKIRQDYLDLTQIRESDVETAQNNIIEIMNKSKKNDEI